MASITGGTATWSPSSLQIRLAFSTSNNIKSNDGRKFPTLLHLRPAHLDRRVRLLCVAQKDPIRVGSDGLPGCSNSEKKESYGGLLSAGGVVGVGVAGVLLLSGLTFAALFVGKKTTARPGEQIKPLTTHQDVLLSSDDHDDEITEHANSGSAVEQGNGNMEGQMDVSRDCSSPESDEIPDYYKIVDDSDIGSRLVYDIDNTYAAIDAATHIPVQEELQHESAVDDKLVITSDGAMALNFSAPENAVDSFNTYGFSDFDNSTPVDSANPIAELKENPFNVEPRNMSHSDVEPQQLITDQQDEITGSRESRMSEISNTSSFVPDNENILVSIGVSPQLNNTTSDPEVFHEDNQENALSASAKENLDLDKMPQASAKSSLKEQSFSENDLFRKPSVTSTSSFIDEQVRNDNDKVYKNRSESPNSGSFYSAPGIPAPSVVSAAVQVLPGKILVPAAVDQVQGQALATLQVLKVIEPDVQPGDLCTRREYARWLVSASGALSRKTISKVYPAMYIDKATELAFDDITPEDPDFSSIQGLAEAGLIESRLSRRDIHLPADEDNSSFYFSPNSPLTRQDLVCWKMALEKRQLPEADRKMLYQLSGFLDANKIHFDACPALLADVSAGERGIIALAFGYTRLFQPHKPVTKAQAAISLVTGDAFDIVSEELARIEAESMAENAVAAHSALVAQVEKDMNAGFQQELSIERDKIIAVERMAEEARCELEKLRAEREEDKIAFRKQRAAIESKRNFFSRLRHEVEDQLQNLVNDKVESAYEKEKISELREQVEGENREIAHLLYELEVERKALSMARAWAEDEAKRVREHAEALERARDRWEGYGIKVVVDDDIRDREEASAGVTLPDAEDQFSIRGTVDRADNLLDKLKIMAADVRGKTRDTIDKIIHVISQLMSRLREWAEKAGKQAEELREVAILKAGKSAYEVQQSAHEFGFAVKEGAKRVVGDCREGVEKLTQKFKT